jgi:hypothetical protein
MTARETLDGSAIVARRLGRIAFGAVLVAGTAYLVAAAFNAGPRPPRYEPQFHAARIIGLTWLAAAVAGFVTSRIAARAHRVWHPERLFAESLMVPAIGIAALGPITLHMAVLLPGWGSSDFDLWVAGSVVVTGLAHVVFATASALRAYELVAGKPARSARSVYIVTVTSSCVPFILLFGIPPILVAITALPFIPLLRAMEPLVARERREMAAAMHPLPRATVRVRDAAGR